MAENTLEEILGENEEKPQAQPSETPKEDPEQKKLDEETQKKRDHLENLNKAIEETNKILRDKRKQIKKPDQDEEDDLPKIDMDDPSSKAWDKHIKDRVNPLQLELEKEKQEIRTFAFKRFLEDRPNLVNSPEKLKKVIETYDRLKTATERTVEGVLIDLDKAYAAENHEELLVAAGQKLVSKAKAEEAFSDIAVSRGSTAYPSQRQKGMPQYSKEDENIVRKWGYDSFPEYYEKVLKPREK